MFYLFHLTCITVTLITIMYMLNFSDVYLSVLNGNRRVHILVTKYFLMIIINFSYNIIKTYVFNYFV